MSSSTNAGDWNARVIAEFRANGGKVGGNFDGAPLLLLHTAGAKTGKERINPMMYQDLGNGSIAVFASKAGADTHPDWYHNISAHPDVTAEIGTDTRGFRRPHRQRRRTRPHLGQAEDRLPRLRRLRGRHHPPDPRRHPRPHLNNDSDSGDPARRELMRRPDSTRLDTPPRVLHRRLVASTTSVSSTCRA